MLIALLYSLYRNLLFNDDMTLTTIFIEPSAYEESAGGNELEGFSDELGSQEESEFLTDESKGEMLERANEIAQKYNSEDFEVVELNTFDDLFKDKVDYVDLIKIEATRAQLDVVKAVSDAGMAVMAHIGIRPQSISRTGVLKAEGVSAEAAAMAALAA